MSEHESDPRETEGERILEANVEQLMRRAEARPEVPKEARGRMLDRIREQRAQSQSSQHEDAPRRATHTPPSPVARKQGRRDRAEAGPADGKRFRPLSAMMLTGLAALLLLGWLFGVGDLLRDGGPEHEPVAYRHDGLGGREIMLADGSRALLRAGTEILEHGPHHLELVAGEMLIEAAPATTSC
ncbi:MAG: hypothetical protein KC457_12525 [Myxococcales bacterium]|nr:hypothetical protein [Myxococcales bacterium]